MYEKNMSYISVKNVLYDTMDFKFTCLIEIILSSSRIN